METSLFHNDTAAVLRTAELRAAARNEVGTSSLIRRCTQGDYHAARALHTGFWPFVSEFELAIDKHRIPRGPLQKRFGTKVANDTFLGVAAAVREMKVEEGSHAAHWRKDASCLGMDILDAPIPNGVKELVKNAYTGDHTRFFAVLAGTEFIAEELGAALAHAEPFTQLFSRKRWVWGEVHLIPHDDGPSHLEIDLDLARAYAPSETTTEDIRAMVLETIRLFGRAANDTESQHAPRLQAAE